MFKKLLLLLLLQPLAYAQVQAPAHTGALAVFSNSPLWSGLLNPTFGGSCNPASIVSPQKCAIDWKQVGIIGGIPSRPACTTSQCNTVTANAGSSTPAQIQAALNSAPANTKVVLPAGNYTLSSDIQVPSNVTLSGSGPQATKLTYTGTSGFPIYVGSKSGNAGDVPNLSNAVNITSGATAGSTSVVVASAANMAVGGLMVVTELNDLVYVSQITINGTCNFCDAYLFHNAGTRVRGQTVKITGVVGTTVTFTPALYTNYGSALGTSPAVASPYGVVSGSMPDATMAGVENLQLYATNSAPNTLVNGSMISLWMCDQCWVKNVEDNWADSNHVSIGYCYRCEVRDSYFSNAFVHASGGSDVELQLAAWSSGVLIQNNILERLHSSIILEWGVAGNVVGYNYSCCTFDSAATNVVNEDVVYHGASPQLNLFEGNVMDNLNLDAFWGSSSNTTAFRNLMRGTVTIAPYTDGTYTASGPSHKTVWWANTHLANQQTRSATITYENTNVNLIGNVLGSADAVTVVGGTGNLYNSGTSPYTSTVFPPNSRVYNGIYYAVNIGYNTGTDSDGTAVSSFNAGPSNTAGYWVGLAKQSIFQHGNFDIASNSTIWASGVTHSLPASFYLSSRPLWWGSLPWPAIGPDVSGGTVDSSVLVGHAYGNPAYACYNSLSRDATGVKIFDANTCYAPNSCTLTFSPSAGHYSTSQNVTISSSGCPSGTQIFYRTDGLPATNIDTQYTGPITVSASQTITAKAVLNPTIRDNPQTISTQKKCNAVGSPITFPSGYSCTNGSGGVAGTASDFNFAAGTTNQMYVSTTDSTAFDTSVLLIDTPTATDNNITEMSFRKVYQDTSNCTQTGPNKYKCIDVSETDAESCCDVTTHALWQMSVRCSTNAAGSSGNNGFIEGDASSGNEKWDIPCVIGATTDLTVNSHWSLGDTGCGGSGCMVLDSIYLNGTKYDFPASCDAGDTNCPNYPMTPQPTYGHFVAGSQDQVYARNVGVAGTSPLTTTRSISFGRVAVDEGTETTGSASYTIP